MKKILQKYKTIRLSEIEMDINQPREDFGTSGEKNRLKRSIKRNGLAQPLSVVERKRKGYLIIDGHRRYLCLKDLEYEKVTCLVFDQNYLKDIELIRHEVQNNRRPWRPLERSEAYAKIRKDSKKEDAEIAKDLGISKRSFLDSVEIREQKVSFASKMERHGLSDAFQTEFIKLRKKLTKTGDFEVVDIMEILFKKIELGVITTAKSLRIIGSCFLRLKSNEQAIGDFLSNIEQTVEILRRDSLLTSFILDIERVQSEIELRATKSIPYLENELLVLEKLQKIIGDAA